MNDGEWIIDGVWKTDWSNLQARRQEGKGAVHEQLQRKRERRELEREKGISGREAAQRLSEERRGSADD